MEIVVLKSQKVLEECLDKDETTITASISSPDNTVDESAINQKPMSWTERRNSEKEKTSFSKYKIDQARTELHKRFSLRTAVHSKCPTCGDLGPETSNQYYTFYLVVPSIITKTKCHRCNVYFSFEYVGMVKSLGDAINLVLDEEL